MAPAAALATPALAQSTDQMADADLCRAALAAEVIVPAIEMFNKIAGDRMQIELFFADQLVPTGELFQRHAARHHRRGSVGRRFNGLAHRRHRVWRLLPVRRPLLARRAGVVQPIRPERNLG